jgi:type IV pilus assembly protein PilA
MLRMLRLNTMNRYTIKKQKTRAKPHEQNQSSRQAGFTLIELMIIIAIIGIIASMAMVSYKDYLTRSKVSTGLELAASTKLAVSEYYSSEGRLPETNAEAGLPMPTSTVSKYANSVGIGVAPSTGTVTITYKGFGDLAAGKTLLLVPSLTGGAVAWDCYSTDLSVTLTPSSCRD